MVARTERRRYRLGRGGVLRGGEGGVAGRHVARGQFDGGAAEKVTIMMTGPDSSKWFGVAFNPLELSVNLN